MIEAVLIAIGAAFLSGFCVGWVVHAVIVDWSRRRYGGFEFDDVYRSFIADADPRDGR